jgi:N-acetylglucosamine-6-phosphate deacetylase
MIVLSGAALVMPDRITGPASIVIDGHRIAEIIFEPSAPPEAATRLDVPGHLIVPGFVDVHVHGVEGYDTLSQDDAITQMASRLPQYGVTAFCPTSIACTPAALRRMLAAVREARTVARPSGARVLPAHLESNFLNPALAGAQPLDCLRVPSADRVGAPGFSGQDILAEIASARPDVAIVTMAPEIVGGLELVRDLAAHGHRVSIGHSAAGYDTALAAIDAGARHATHLFNRMTGLTTREPGVVGAVLESDEVTAELICDGVHVHPATMRAAIAAKGPSHTIAITDGTSGSGLPRGSRATLGGRPIAIEDVARLDDGTFAGSVLTMDVAFRRLVGLVGVSPVDAALMCSTTPARALGLHGHGVLVTGAVADLVVLDSQYRVVQTWVGGELAWSGDRLLR